MLDIIASYHCMQFQVKLMNQTWENEKMGKNLVSGQIQIPTANFFFFFSKIFLRQSLDIMVSYHHVQYQKKLMIQSWGNLVTDGRTDGTIDRQADESDFIGRCPINVECPKGKHGVINHK